MAKSKEKKAAQKGFQSHLRARLNYLERAAIYLQSATTSPNAVSANPDSKGKNTVEPNHQGSYAMQHASVTENEAQRSVTNGNSGNSSLTASLSRQYISQMRGVSLKTRLRLPVEVKRSFCKRCHLILTPGLNCVLDVRNESKGCKKPWANVLIIRCNACKTEKRFPQAQSKRSDKLASRQSRMKQNKDNGGSGDGSKENC